jgi:hypothetical protein
MNQQGTFNGWKADKEGLWVTLSGGGDLAWLQAY